LSVFYERFFLIDCGRVEKIMFTWVHEFSEKCLPESMNSLNILNAKMPQLCLQYRATEKQEQTFHKNSFRIILRTSSVSRYKIIYRIMNIIFWLVFNTWYTWWTFIVKITLFHFIIDYVLLYALTSSLNITKQI